MEQAIKKYWPPGGDATGLFAPEAPALISLEFHRLAGRQADAAEAWTEFTRFYSVMRKVIARFSAFALVIVCAALLLPYFMDHIAAETGLNKTFAGTLLLAVSTSLPEIAVSLAAIRLGSIDLAVGNLLGSNLFNIFILALDDIFYAKGHLLKDASDLNLLSCLATIIMAAVAIIGLSYRLQAKRFWLAWDALLIFGIYIINILLLYHLSS